MEDIIRFRQLLGDLSKDELDQFNKRCLQIFEEYSSNLAIFIFDYFMNQWKTAHNRHDSLQMHQFNNVILNIIQQRKPDTNNTNEPQIEEKEEENETKLEVSDLPQNMIQEIASFLPIKSYSMFECCNRNVFVAIRTTPTLYELCIENNEEMMKHMSCLSRSKQALFMKRFNRVQVMKVTKRNFNVIKDIKCTKLRELTLDIDDDVFDFLTCSTIKKSNIFPWDALHTLRVDYCGSTETVTLPAAICEMLTECSNLQRLTLNADPLHCKLAKVPFKHLKHLCISCYNINMRSLLHKISNQLHSLHLMDCNQVFRNLKFTKLQALSSSFAGLDTIVIILKNAPQIRLLCIDQIQLYESSIDDAMQCILKLKSLQYLTFTNCVPDIIPVMVASFNKHLNTNNACKKRTNIVMRFEDDFCSLSSYDMFLANFQTLCDLVAKWSNEFELSICFGIDEYLEIAYEILVWRRQSSFSVVTKDGEGVLKKQKFLVVSSINCIKPRAQNFNHPWKCCHDLCDIDIELINS